MDLEEKILVFNDRAVRFAAIDFESKPLAGERVQAAVEIGIAVAKEGDFSIEEVWGTELGVGLSEMGERGGEEKKSPRLLELWAEVQRFLSGRVLLAHGAGTERRFLRAFPGHGFGPWVDTLRLSRAAFPEAQSHSLPELCEWLGIGKRLRERRDWGQGWHEARFDAAACMLLFFEICERAGIIPWEANTISGLMSPSLKRYFQTRRSRKWM